MTIKALSLRITSERSLDTLSSQLSSDSRIDLSHSFGKSVLPGLINTENPQERGFVAQLTFSQMVLIVCVI